MTEQQAGAASDTGPLLELEGIVKQWPRQADRVLDGVRLRVPGGCTYAIHGRNGAGKTTLLRIAAGLLAPDEGNVTVGGVPVTDRRRFQSAVGLVSAGNGALYARLTVDNHLEFGTRLAMLRGERRRELVGRARRSFELDELRGRRVDRLSTGQRQRLRLALGFVHEPRVMLLDEPEGSLDDEAVALLGAALEDLHERGGCAVVCAPTGVRDRLRIDRSLFVVDGRVSEG